MTSKTGQVTDSRQELAELVRKKAEISVSTLSIYHQLN